MRNIVDLLVKAYRYIFEDKGHVTAIVSLLWVLYDISAHRASYDTAIPVVTAALSQLSRRKTDEPASQLGDQIGKRV